ncbi:MAG: hypothetical protein IJE90_04925 [Clostridia bacterium]|nr:hypothetical protein [Clostridia bacterium]
MKNLKVSSTMFFIAAVLFNLAAVITFFSGNHNSTAVIWLCLGSTFLCLGTVYSKKSTENKNTENDTESRED